MARCPFYKTQIIEHESQEIRADRGRSVSHSHLEWCEHKHSPQTKRAVHSLGGGALKIGCYGEIDRCVIPEPEQGDLG